MRLCALFLLFLCCYADYIKQSYWPNTQCSGVPSAENFLNVGLGGCVSSGDHSTRSLCTNMSYGESRSYSSNDCTGIYSRTPIVFDPACLSDGNYFFGLSTLSACVSTDEKNFAPSSAAPNTVLYKSYLVDSCNLISPQTLDYFLVFSTSSCIPRSTQISDGYICNSSGTYKATYGPGCIGQPISTFKGFKLGCGPDPERNNYFVSDVSCSSGTSQAQGSSTYSATVLGAGIGGTAMGMGLIAGGVLLWRRRTASAAEHTPLMSS